MAYALHMRKMVDTTFCLSLNWRLGIRNRYFGMWNFEENHSRTLVRRILCSKEKNMPVTRLRSLETLGSLLPLWETSLGTNWFPVFTGIHGLSIVNGTKVSRWQVDCPISNCPTRGQASPGYPEYASGYAFQPWRQSPNGEADL